MFMSLIILAGGLFLGGVISKWLPGGTVASDADVGEQEGVSASTCRDSVAPDIRGKAATIRLSAWDLASNTPYSAPVDFGTSCWLFKNDRFVNTTIATNGASVTGFSVGDTVSVYCGGTSYYAPTAVENFCIDSETPTVDIDAYTVVATTNLATTAYDDQDTVLDAGAPTDGADYNITLGASEEKVISVKQKVNVADKAYNFGGWAIVKFSNITTAEPVSGYAAAVTPAFLEAVNVSTGDSGISQFKDYVPYVRSSPLLLEEWDSIKDDFTIKSGSGDPNGGQNTTNFDGVGFVSFDVTWVRGDDGKMYYDFYDHTSAGSNVGITETITSPIGKDNSCLISAE
jgi:hypothetical protein